MIESLLNWVMGIFGERKPSMNGEDNGNNGSQTETENINLDAQRDSLDFRDLIYRPALVQLKEELIPSSKRLHIMNQGREGACTGFGLAAVINYLLRTREENQRQTHREPDDPAQKRASARMLYQMAKRHDQWPGQDYQGSSARGAMHNPSQSTMVTP